MGILWNKRQNGNEMVFVDILEDKEFNMRQFHVEMISELKESEVKNLLLVKDEEISSKMRMDGNSKVRMGDVNEAMSFYNRAICPAKPGTENLGVCYANRAACFMKMKCYSLCLNDIESAKQNGYPVRLYPKLDDRRATCLKLMKKNGEPCCDEPNLSFPAHDHIPGFVEGLDLKQAKNGRKKIVAKRDFDIGETIVIEKAYESTAIHNYIQCCNCLKRDVNFIPCRKCIHSMFCSQECYDEAHERFHDIECGIGHRINYWDTRRRLALRTVITAIRTFGTVEALIDVIELFNNATKFSDTDPAKRNYYEFFTSSRGSEKYSFEGEQRLRKDLLIVQTVILNESQLRSKFQTEKQKLFLSHLILHHIYVIHKNVFIASSSIQSTHVASSSIQSLEC